MALGTTETESLRGAASTPSHRVRRWSLAYALAASVAAYIGAAGNTFRVNGVIAWAAAVGFWLHAWWPQQRPLFDSGQPSQRRARPWVLVTLAVIIGVGVFFRFHRLHDTPSDPTSDHAEKLLDVQDILDGKRPIFFPRNTGRETAQFYVIAGMVSGLGMPPNFDTMKIGTAAIDVLTIPAIYLLAAEIGGPAVGLGAAAAYSISAWPVGIARAGLRFPYAPLPTALSLWLLLRYLRRGDRRDALLLGATLGAGLYGYSPFRVVVPVIPLALGLTWLLDTRWRSVRDHLLRDGALIAATAAIVFIPLGRFMLEHPEIFWYRAASRAAGDQVTPDVGLQPMLDGAGVFLLNNWNALLAFNLRGDSTFVNALQYAPFLDFLSGALFLLGLALAIRAIVKQHDLRWLILLAAIPILFLSSTLALSFPIENPSVNRAGPVLPVAFSIVGLGLATLVAAAFARREWSTWALASLLLVIGFAVAASENYERYFVHFDAQYREFVPNTGEIAEAVKPELNRGLPLDRVYAFNWPYWFDTRNLGIALGNIRWAERHSIPSESTVPEPNGSELLLIINREDQRHLNEIRRRWPNATIRHVESPEPGKDFYLALLPAW